VLIRMSGTGRKLDNQQEVGNSTRQRCYLGGIILIQYIVLSTPI
jgi:hypothetical protein